MCIFNGQKFERIETLLDRDAIQLPILDWKREQLPDAVIVGWRSWSTSFTGAGTPRLVSPHAGFVWSARAPMHSRALLSLDYPYGIFAYRGRAPVETLPIFGEVALWGTVISYKARAGTKSAFANYRHYCGEHLARALSRAYRVPVHVRGPRGRWVEV